MKKTIFIGPFGGGEIPTNGASVKNYHILSCIRPLIPSLIEIDTENWKRNPFVILKIIAKALLYPKAKYILSLNTSSANKLIRLLNRLSPKSEKVYWVIGGSFGKKIKEGKLTVNPYMKLDNIIVEGESMKSDLLEAGLKNISVMQNFKKLPNDTITIDNGFNVRVKSRLRFVFLSRIIPQKGCDIILDVAEKLNREGYSDNYEISFYGPIENSYRDKFLEYVDRLENVQYKGFIDLRNSDGYNELATYDAMLFPTYWPGEGCPGIIIDAYISGLPVLASDWNLNKDYVSDGKSGKLFSAKSIDALYELLIQYIHKPEMLFSMKAFAKEMSSKFDIRKVLSKDNLIANKILEA